jgi:hypothetical protein
MTAVALRSYRNERAHGASVKGRRDPGQRLLLAKAKRETIVLPTRGRQGCKLTRPVLLNALNAL